MKRRQSMAISLALAFVAAPALAFFDPPWLAPEHPAAGQQVSVAIRGGICHGIDNVQSIVRNGNQIRILFFGVRYYDPLHCNEEIGQATFPIGAFPAGDYVLTVDFMYFTPGGGDRTDTLGVIPFTVSGIPTAAPAPAPAYGVPALILLGAAMIALAWRSLHSGIDSSATR